MRFGWLAVAGRLARRGGQGEQAVVLFEDLPRERDESRLEPRLHVEFREDLGHVGFRGALGDP
ncbi:hypothetical protein [Actinophytocola glycyrrhizae]|uniref:Uncharacterized protein n=1 Tax=Actinophytocola glycyrrhizae TaxID=2044873 RepID=A0ABV9RZY1_9PSEU